MLSTAFSNRVLYLLPLLLGWQAWRVCGGNTRGQWSLSGVLSGLLVFPTTTNCILTVGFPSQFFSYGRRKIFISHLHLQIWNLNHLTSSFCPCLFPAAGCTGMSFCSVCMHIFTLLISKEKKPFWILALRWWECGAVLLCLEMSSKKPQVFLSESTFLF